MVGCFVTALMPTGFHGGIVGGRMLKRGVSGRLGACIGILNVSHHDRRTYTMLAPVWLVTLHTRISVRTQMRVRSDINWVACAIEY